MNTDDSIDAPWIRQFVIHFNENCLESIYRWIMKAVNFLLPLILFIGLLPSSTFALAGLGEKSSYFHYNRYAKIERGHPSDLCSGSTKWCLALIKGEHEDFKGLHSSFEKVNVPINDSTPYIIGLRSSDNSWLVYDLKKEQILIADIDYKKVINVWYSLGLTKPTYVDARNIRELLTETDKSVALRRKVGLIMWWYRGIPLTLIALVFWYLSRECRKQYKKSNSKVFQVFAFLFLLPFFFLIYIMISSLIKVIFQN